VNVAQFLSPIYPALSIAGCEDTSEAVAMIGRNERFENLNTQ